MSESTVLAVLRPSAAVAPAPAASPRLTTARGAALYIGALLGPGLLLLPGLAAAEAGPASLLAWAGLLGLSALFAVVFTALGRAFPSAGGVIGYVTCSPVPAETRDVVNAVVSQQDGIDIIDAPAVLPEVPDLRSLSARFAQFWPHRHGTDAIFIALLRRTR